MSLRRGRGGRNIIPSNRLTRSMAARAIATNNSAEDLNLHFSDSEEHGEPSYQPVDTNVPTHSLQRQSPIHEANEDIASSQEQNFNNNKQSNSLTAEEVQRMINHSIVLQTEKLTEMFNRVLVHKLASFRTPPHSLGLPPVCSENYPNLLPFPSRFNDSDYENNIPRQSVAQRAFQPNSPASTSQNSGLTRTPTASNANDNPLNISLMFRQEILMNKTHTIFNKDLLQALKIPVINP